VTYEDACGRFNQARLTPAQRESFTAWVAKNLPETPEIDQGDTTSAGKSFAAAGARVDYLVRCYRAREDTHASYAEAMDNIVAMPENRELKIAFSRETGRAAR